MSVCRETGESDGFVWQLRVDYPLLSTVALFSFYFRPVVTIITSQSIYKRRKRDHDSDPLTDDPE